MSSRSPYAVDAAAIFKMALATARRTRKSDDYRAAAHWANEAAVKAPYGSKENYWTQAEELNAMADTLKKPAMHSVSHVHARKKKIAPREMKRRLTAAGIDFSQDFHQLPRSAVDLILDGARATGYRKSKGAPGSTARMYFQYLNRLR